MRVLCKVATEVLEREFGKLNTNEVIVTDERERHIRLRHPDDYALYKAYAARTVEEPDYIICDDRRRHTVFMISRLENTNLNVVVRLAVAGDDASHIKNSVMTFFRLREKNLKKLMRTNRVLYNRAET